MLRVFEDFRYVREYEAPEGDGHVLMFEASVGGKAVTGADFLRVDDAGLVTELMVMVRPLSAATALAEAMGAQFPQIQAEATAEL